MHPAVAAFDKERKACGMSLNDAHVLTGVTLLGYKFWLYYDRCPQEWRIEGIEAARSALIESRQAGILPVILPNGKPDTKARAKIVKQLVRRLNDI